MEEKISAYISDVLKSNSPFMKHQKKSKITSFCIQKINSNKEACSDEYLFIASYVPRTVLEHRGIAVNNNKIFMEIIF